MGAMFYTCYKTDFAVAIHSYTVKNPTHRLYVMGRRAYCWWTLGTPETCTSFWKVLGARSNIHYIALEEGYLYVFANECPANVKEEDWKACLGRVCQRFNTLYTSVRGVKTSDALFRMYKKDKPNSTGVMDCWRIVSSLFVWQSQTALLDLACTPSALFNWTNTLRIPCIQCCILATSFLMKKWKSRSLP